MTAQNTIVTTGPKAVELPADTPRKPMGRRAGGPKVTGGSRDARRIRCRDAGGDGRHPDSHRCRHRPGASPCPGITSWRSGPWRA